MFKVAMYNFRGWHKNPRIIITFILAFILCFLLTDKAVSFSSDFKTTMQIAEPFIWTFGDSNSIMLSAMLLAVLFSDMPFITAGTPLYLVRIDKKTWISGQIVYIVITVAIYMLFILTSTTILCANNAFIGNMWSYTAAILGYSGVGKEIALPALVKTLEMTTPYECLGTIVLLMTMYALLMSFIMLVLNLKFGQLVASCGVLAFNLVGFALNPSTIASILDLPETAMYKANVTVGWASPLNHATYHMHNFGYDMLPELWHTFAIFGGLILILYFLALHISKKYEFVFTGTEA